MDPRCTIEDIAASQRGETLVEQLALLWERSVRATHLFLSEDDIVAMRPEVREGLRAVPPSAMGRRSGLRASPTASSRCSSSTMRRAGRGSDPPS